MLLNYIVRFVLNSFCWRFGAAGFEWCPCCRLKHSSLCVGDLVRLGLSSAHVAG